MATLVYLKNPTNNLVAKAYVGFSWTSLFFGPWPLLFRTEWGFFLVFIAVYIVVGAFTRMIADTEAQQRTMLRLSLEADPEERSQLPLRQGRAIRWIEEALAPMQPDVPAKEVHRLALAIRSATGIEALVWLIDVAGLSRNDARALMRWSARAMLDAALAARASADASRSSQRGR